MIDAKQVSTKERNPASPVFARPACSNFCACSSSLSFSRKLWSESHCPLWIDCSTAAFLAKLCNSSSITCAFCARSATRKASWLWPNLIYNRIKFLASATLSGETANNCSRAKAWVCFNPRALAASAKKRCPSGWYTSLAINPSIGFKAAAGSFLIFPARLIPAKEYPIFEKKPPPLEEGTPASLYCASRNSWRISKHAGCVSAICPSILIAKLGFLLMDFRAFSICFCRRRSIFFRGISSITKFV